MVKQLLIVAPSAVGRTLLFVVLTWSVSAGARAQTATNAVVIRGATVLTVTNGTIEGGTVVLRDGRIAAVGAQVEAPEGAEIVDATGRYVTPGIIDAHSHIAAESINEGGTSVSSMTGIEDVLEPFDINIYRDLAGGLTTANVLHGSANPIGGKNAVIKLRWGVTDPHELLFEGAPPGIKFALGENTKRQGRQPDPRRYPMTRPGVEYVIRDAFTRAKAYRAEWEAYARRRAAGERVLPPRRDLQLEPLVEILEGTRLVHAHSYRADEILMLIRLAEEMGFQIATFQHVLEGYKVAKEIAAHGAGASTFSDWWGYKVEAFDAIPHNAALMRRKGVLVSINSDSAEHARRLNTEAAKSVKWGGLSEDEAFELVTINPARQLRIDDRVGSLEVGKDADVVIWTDHPLSTYALADRVYIDGTLYYDRQAAAQRLTDVRREKAELMASIPPTPAASPSEQPPTPPRRASGTTRGTNGDPVDEPGEISRIGDRTAQGPPNGALAITNARIHPVTAPVIERGAVIIRDGRIDAVGASVAVPAGAEVIDAAGADVYPGWIDARSTLGIAEPGAGGYRDTDEMLDFNPQLRTRVAFHSDSVAIPVARTNGVTATGVTPSGGLLGGEVAVMNLDGWTWEENTVDPVVGIAFQFPAVGGGGGFGGPPARDYDEQVETQRARLDEVAAVLEDARVYARAGADGRQANWMLEALVPVVRRELPLFTYVDREADIRAAIQFADRVGIDIVVSGGREAALVAPLLAERDIPVILGPVLGLPTREDMAHAASYQAAGELAREGVRLAFATGGNTNVRLLPYHAAISVAWGLDRQRAIEALTIDAARILGVDDVLGSIEPGKMANVFISRGDPLDIRTEVTHVFIRGRSVGVEDRHTALYERYKARP